MIDIKKIKKLYKNNMKLLKSYGFTNAVKQIFIALFLCITILTTSSQVNASDRYSVTTEKIRYTQSSQRLILTNEERDLLAKLITSEAKGESYNGKVAVASVVLNRVYDSNFPNNIMDVIYQKGAFEPVMTGTIYQDADPSSYRAIDDALKGKDPTNNALYFWNPKTSTSRWIYTMSPHMRIGNHVFAK